MPRPDELPDVLNGVDKLGHSRLLMLGIHEQSEPGNTDHSLFLRAGANLLVRDVAVVRGKFLGRGMTEDGRFYRQLERIERRANSHM